MLEGERQVVLHVYLQKGFFTKRLFKVAVTYKETIGRGGYFDRSSPSGGVL